MFALFLIVLAVIGLVNCSVLRGIEHEQLEAKTCKPLGVPSGGVCLPAASCTSSYGRVYSSVSCLFCCMGSSDKCCVLPSEGSSSSSAISSSISGSSTYCPRSKDLTVAYGGPSITNGGWTIYGGGGVATKAAFNLLGSSVEYDVDTTDVKIGVNANMYTISPTLTGPFSQSYYCDGQKLGRLWCLEVDWLETNGNCGGATALHTVSGTGTGCTNWGCYGQFSYNGRTSFHMKINTDINGVITVIRDGVVVSINQNGSPGTKDWNIIKNSYGTKGAVIYSSQWVGWVPSVGGRCSSSDGDLARSVYTVSNLRITAPRGVISGPVPPLC